MKPGTVQRDTAVTLDGWDQAIFYGDDSLASIVTALQIDGITAPAVGADVGPSSDWQVEWAWFGTKVALTVDLDEARDEWLTENGWTVIEAQPGFDVDGVLNTLKGAFSLI